MQVHKIVFKEVQDIVNEIDPVGLVSGGAPEDEYHTEVGKIVELLRAESNVETLASKVAEIFKEQFGSIDHNEGSYLTLSKKLIELKTRLRW